LPPSPSTNGTAVSAPSREPDRAVVLEFCERYRRALEARDADALLALASRRYKEEDGNTYETLAASMRRLMTYANKIRYEIQYGDVTTRADGAIEVPYHYAASFLTAAGWQHKVAESTLVLERRGDSFAILSGM
jgi:hypothetical protein